MAEKEVDRIQKLSKADATHNILMHTTQGFISQRTTYLRPVVLLKEMPHNRVKVCMFGDNKNYLKYVPASRLSPLNE